MKKEEAIRREKESMRKKALREEEKRKEREEKKKKRLIDLKNELDKFIEEISDDGKDKKRRKQWLEFMIEDDDSILGRFIQRGNPNLFNTMKKFKASFQENENNLRKRYGGGE